jgi:hypothetical protein
MLDPPAHKVVSNKKTTTTATAVGMAHQWWDGFRFPQNDYYAHLDLNDNIRRLRCCDLLTDSMAAENTIARTISIATRRKLPAPLQVEAMAPV